MSANHKCESCGMPIDAGVHCRYCTDQTGKLQEFDERLERMTQWVVKQKQGATRAEAEQQALAHMATMPAWRNHPKLLARTQRGA
jgi:hypothetical protein